MFASERKDSARAEEDEKDDFVLTVDGRVETRDEVDDDSRLEKEESEMRGQRRRKLEKRDAKRTGSPR